VTPALDDTGAFGFFVVASTLGLVVAGGLADPTLLGSLSLLVVLIKCLGRGCLLGIYE
jgi:hypothetical protein